ncbi:MAG TPA: DUF1810 domain-containing protein [Burkholderiaceae bacterium]
MDEQYALQRFVAAQHNVMPAVFDELRAGRKHTHWMWFVFPQLAGLGRSAMAQRYALSGVAEARAYLLHPVLGQRLRLCSELVLAAPRRTAHAVFGSPDDLKFHSCMTLFAALESNTIFARNLLRYFEGQPDPATLALLGAYA